MQPYEAETEQWRHVGRTPLKDVRLPRGVFQLRIEKDGYEPLRVAAPNPSTLLGNATNRLAAAMALSLTPTDSARGMVPVPGGAFPVSLNAFSTTDPIALEPFMIDRFEVTNEQFKRFVDNGGYARAEYWDGLPFTIDGQPASWQKWSAQFRDTTGAPGPAPWASGLTRQERGSARERRELVTKRWRIVDPEARCCRRSITGGGRRSHQTRCSRRWRPRSLPGAIFGTRDQLPLERSVALALMAHTTWRGTSKSGPGTRRSRDTVGFRAVRGVISRTCWWFVTARRHRTARQRTVSDVPTTAKPSFPKNSPALCFARSRAPNGRRPFPSYSRRSGINTFNQRTLESARRIDRHHGH